MVQVRMGAVLLAVCVAAGMTARGQEKSVPAQPGAGQVQAAKDSAEGAADKSADDKDADGKDSGGKGKKGAKKKKEKPPKLMPMTIVNGSLTMDGITGKAGMNYDIDDLHYVYIWAPGVGTVVISNKAFPGAVEQKKGFSMNAVSVTVEEHKLEIYSDKPLFNKGKEKELVRDVQGGLVSAWVLVDKEFTLPTPYPAMGFGLALAAPYAWPGAKPGEKRAGGVVTPPPLPAWIRPAMAGQEAKAGPANGSAPAAGQEKPAPVQGTQP